VSGARGRLALARLVRLDAEIRAFHSFLDAADQPGLAGIVAIGIAQEGLHHVIADRAVDRGIAGGQPNDGCSSRWTNAAPTRGSISSVNAIP